MSNINSAYFIHIIPKIRGAKAPCPPGSYAYDSVCVCVHCYCMCAYVYDVHIQLHYCVMWLGVMGVCVQLTCQWFTSSPSLLLPLPPPPPPSSSPSPSLPLLLPLPPPPRSLTSCILLHHLQSPPEHWLTVSLCLPPACTDQPKAHPSPGHQHLMGQTHQLVINPYSHHLHNRKLSSCPWKQAGATKMAPKHMSSITHFRRTKQFVFSKQLNFRIIINHALTFSRH